MASKTDKRRPSNRVNHICHCGSGKKYKRCCMRTDEEKYRETPEEKPQSAKQQRKNQLALASMMAIAESGNALYRMRK